MTDQIAIPSVPVDLHDQMWGMVTSYWVSQIVRAVVDLANAMGIEALAEGVEQLDQLEYLRMLGCTVGQGYLFSKPLPTEEFDQLLGLQFASSNGGLLPEDALAS